MVNKNSKKLVFGALSAIAASVAAGVFVKKTMQNKEENDSEKEKKKKKSKNVYYTVSLNEIYNTYDDKTFSEEDMINEIKKETSL
ncbi:Uncharacterised protein [uncultured Clostridium sp.]|uniref:hypothetical protein n=1 Tax=uncultured Clostridium sp. TaxID=59620 RepID=UPI000822CF4B|nr:hypothetical protein [uncultured Clostridium sp.]SCJ62044.1 Uncharacterised protein [uncultured Clostridium sp.]